jgi:uncharacterized integral membrane protein
MPWRMIILLLVIVLFATFAGFNLDPIKISVGFYQFENIPTFFALVIAFIFGTLIMLPFTLKAFRGKKKAKKELETVMPEIPQEIEQPVIVEELPSDKKSKRKNKKKS